MNTFFSSLKTSFLLTVVFTIVLCVFYPAAVWGVGQSLFAKQANGSLIMDTEGRVLGSALIGQAFVSSRYFHGRPSAAGTGYDATASSGSNLGPTSRKLADTIRANLTTYRSENHLPASAAVPADAVTASGSGLDPHISVNNALLQISRIAAERQLTLTQLRGLIEQHTEERDLGVLGEPRINVLLLNQALDQLDETQRAR